MRSNAHTRQQRKVTYQTYNARVLTQAQRFVRIGAHLIQVILYVLHWLSVALLQSLMNARALQTSLARLHGVKTQPAQVAPGERQSHLAGFKSVTPAPQCHLPVRLLLTPGQKLAALIKAVKKCIQERIYALTPTVNRYQAHGS
jgi:hypothetical protein